MNPSLAILNRLPIPHHFDLLSISAILNRLPIPHHFDLLSISAISISSQSRRGSHEIDLSCDPDPSRSALNPVAAPMRSISAATPEPSQSALNPAAAPMRSISLATPDLSFHVVSISKQI